MSMQFSLLGLAFLILLFYATWAVVLTDNRFHRVWSLALSLLLFLAGRLFNEPFSASSIPLAIHVLFVLVICIVLSPAQVFLFHTKPIGPKREALKIFEPANEKDCSVELVPLLHPIKTLSLTLLSRLVSWLSMVLQKIQTQHGCLNYPKIASPRTATRPCGSGTSYQRKRV